jgi:hypothetical protein
MTITEAPKPTPRLHLDPRCMAWLEPRTFNKIGAGYSLHGISPSPWRKATGPMLIFRCRVAKPSVWHTGNQTGRLFAQRKSRSMASRSRSWNASRVSTWYLIPIEALIIVLPTATAVSLSKTSTRCSTAPMTRSSKLRRADCAIGPSSSGLSSMTDSVVLASTSAGVR